MGDNAEYVKREFAAKLEGRTIINVREMTSDEMEDFCWEPTISEVPIVLLLNDGTLVVPQCDDEGNGPGTLLIQEPYLITELEEVARRLVDLG